MKKLKYFIITILITFCLLPNYALAKGNVTVSTTNLTITKGGSATLTITVDNSAGRIDITSSNSNIASVSESSIFLDSQSGKITIKGNSTGTTTIKVQAVDVTTYDDEDLTGKTYTINVNVSDPKPTINPNLSTNNKLKEITVDDHKLEKVDDNNYKLTVNNDVTSIKLNIAAEDRKTKITGDGTHELNIGVNNIEVILTSESGSQNKININVTRKEGYYLEDLESLLNKNDSKNINILIKEDSKITKEELLKIKESKKNIKLNYFDENKKLIYSWTINGKSINNTKEFLTSISYISDYVEDISKLSNYANGLHANFKYNGKLPEGTKIKLYVGDKFDNGNKVKVYYYNKFVNNLELIKDNLKVEEGYIEFDIEHCSEYFVTMSNIGISKEENVQTSSINIFLIISIIELLAIITILVIYFIKIKPILKSIKIVEEHNNNLSNETIVNSENINIER